MWLVFVRERSSSTHQWWPEPVVCSVVCGVCVFCVVCGVCGRVVCGVCGVCVLCGVCGVCGVCVWCVCSTLHYNYKEVVSLNPISHITLCTCACSSIQCVLICGHCLVCLVVTVWIATCVLHVVTKSRVIGK